MQKYGDRKTNDKKKRQKLLVRSPHLPEAMSKIMGIAMPILSHNIWYQLQKSREGFNEFVTEVGITASVFLLKHNKYNLVDEKD